MAGVETTKTGVTGGEVRKVTETHHVCQSEAGLMSTEGHDLTTEINRSSPAAVLGADEAGRKEAGRLSMRLLQ